MTWPIVWINVSHHLITILVFVITLNLYDSWLLSIGLTAASLILYLLLTVPVMIRLRIPIQVWRILAQRFPCSTEVNPGRVDFDGRGAINDCPVPLAVVAKEDALSVRILMVRFLRPKTITIPWDRMEILREWTNPDGDHVATVSFPKLRNCELVLPWQSEFTKFHERT